MSADCEGFHCGTQGPVTRKREDGLVMSRLICDRKQGHDGPHRTGTVEWSDTDAE